MKQCACSREPQHIFVLLRSQESFSAPPALFFSFSIFYENDYVLDWPLKLMGIPQ